MHGYAQAGFGNLSQDWLANTADPTPVFSFLVALTLRIFNSGILFYLYYALLMGVYFFSLFGIVDRLFPLRTRKLTSGVFVAAVLLLHSAALRYILQQLFGGDWPYLFEGGVAGQRLLGAVFQPSTFGVFLLLSVYLYLTDRKVFAVLAAVLAATVHPTYLLSAAALTLAFLFDTWRSGKKFWPVLQLGFLALIAVSPILIYSYINFWGGDPVVNAAARNILVNSRIPPHAIFRDWFNATVVVKLAFIGLALFLIRRHRLFWILLIPLCISIGLTVLQVAINSDALALIFPWRISTWLVPLSVGLILGWLVTVLAARIPAAMESTIKIAALVLIALAVAAGISRSYLVGKLWAGLPYRPLEVWVSLHRQPGEQVLVPSDIYDFRLETGLPVYVDFLSIPYQSAQVVEWDRRFRKQSLFYQTAACSRLDEISRAGITHVVLPVGFPKVCSGLVEIYSDSQYVLYKISP